MGLASACSSSTGANFSYDFGVTIDESVGPAAYNFRTKAEFEAMGSDFTALGRPQDWEEPKGRSESARAAVPDFAS